MTFCSNLTNANHIIFACPLLTDTQASYNAVMTQCIGRAKRYGQLKTVYIYQFLALRTIDVDVLQEREQKTLVRKVVQKEVRRGKKPGTKEAREKESVWEMVDQSEMDESMEIGWGSGHNFKSVMGPNDQEGR